MLSGISEFLLVWLEKLIDTIGYVGIFVAIVVENIFPPLPSEVIMFGAGILVAEGRFNLWIVCLAATLGALVASYIFYGVGLYGGRPLLEKYGKYVRISTEDIEYTERWFAKYGDAVVFFGRFIPVVRTLVSFPAGVARVHLLKFSIYTAVGSFIWLLFLTYLGIEFGERQDYVLSLLDRYEKIILIAFILIALTAAWLFYQKKFGKKTKPTTPKQ